MTAIWHAQPVPLNAERDKLGSSRFAFLDTQHTSVTALKKLINACVEDAGQILADEL